MISVAPAGWKEVTANYYALPFGIIGLASAWQAAAVMLAAPRWVGPVLLILAACMWTAVSVAYVTRCVRRPAAIRTELTDPALSTFASFAPICVALLGPNRHRHDLARVPAPRHRIL